MAALAQAHLDPVKFLGAPRGVMEEALAHQLAAAAAAGEALRTGRDSKDAAGHRGRIYGASSGGGEAGVRASELSSGLGAAEAYLDAIGFGPAERGALRAALLLPERA